MLISALRSCYDQGLTSPEASVEWFKFLIKMLTSRNEEHTFLVTDIAQPVLEVFPKAFVKCLLVLVK